MIVKELSNGDFVESNGHVIKIHFEAPRKVLSTCAANGGYQIHLTDVFNYDSSHNKTIYSEMKADTIEGHMHVTAKELGFDPMTTCGMCTSAQMEHVSIREDSFHGVTVTAIVTGGIDINGGRVGDKASWFEEGNAIHLLEGTINIILVIDADLPPGILTSAMTTAIEAKVAAVQELLLPSKYSMGIATGSGTDKIIVIANPSAKERLTDAGKHSKLGELIGITVLSAVKEALMKQTNACYESQHTIIARMERFGFERERILRQIRMQLSQEECALNKLEQMFDLLNQDAAAVTITSLYAHLIDQYLWGLLRKEEAWDAANKLLRLLTTDVFENLKLDSDDLLHGEETVIAAMIDRFEKTIGHLLLSQTVFLQSVTKL